METDYLNMRDEQQRYPSLSIMEQNDYVMPNPLPTPLCEEGSLLKVVESDFDYMENQLDTSGLSWGSEQELNGDMAVLPVSGVASVYPKMECLSEDFAKVLNDWQEHLGFLETCEFEERMNLLDIDRPSSRYPVLPENIFDDDFHPPSKSEKKILDDDSLKASLDLVNDLEASGSSALDCSIDETKEETKETVEVKKKIRKNVNNQKIKKEVKKEIHCDDDLDEENWFLNDMDLIETSSVLEAGDVTDLLEQFEASEKPPETSTKNDETKEPLQEETKKKKKREISSTKEEDVEIPPTKKRKSEKKTKIIEPVPKKPVKIQENPQRDVKKTLPKEVIDRIQASNRKKPISVIPALPEKKVGVRCKGTKMQDAAPTRNKQLKIQTTNKNSSPEGSVQLDHDYCSNGNAINSKSKTSGKQKVKKISKKITKLEPQKQVSNDKVTSVLAVDTILKKPNNCLESTKQNNVREEKINAPSDSKESEKIKKKQFSLKKVEIAQIVDNKQSPFKENNKTFKETTTIATVKKSFPEMKVRPTVATSILQTRKGVITKTKPIDGPQKMISVLKKPPQPSQTLICNKPNESIVTTTNSLNNEVQNIIVQTQPIEAQENDKKLPPPRKKLNLAEYRSRREQNRSDNSRTNSPIQPMTLVYIYHASTTTHPIQTDHDNVIWSEREIVSILKPKSEIEEIKVEAKPSVRDASIQTNETVFNQTPRSNFEAASINSKKAENYVKRSIDNRSDKRSIVNRSVDNKRSQTENKNDNRRQIDVKTANDNKRKIEIKIESKQNIDGKSQMESKRQEKLENKGQIDEKLVENKSPESRGDNKQLDKKTMDNKQLDKKLLDNKQLEKKLMDNKQLEKKLMDNKQLEKKLLDNKQLDNKHSDNKQSDNKQSDKQFDYKQLANKQLDNKSSPESKRIMDQNSSQKLENKSVPDRSKSRDKSTERSKSIERTNNAKKISSVTNGKSESSGAKDIDERIRPTGKRVRNYRRRGSSESSRSLSRSRSRSRSRIRSRNRNRNRSRSKSRSCRRTPERRRRISHRRSSVSSSSSWSSRSYTKSSSSFRTRSSRSRSRSPRFSRSRSISRSRSRSRSKSRLRSRSRSRSSSRFSSCSRLSSRSIFTRSRWSGRRRWENRERKQSYDRNRRRSSGSSNDNRNLRRSTSRSYKRPYDGWYDREKQRQVEERRVIYVGRLEEGITKADLRRRFETFGPVVDISVHFREHGDNYGFVTFAYKSDAYKAVERGNENPSLPRYDLCFGGRRAFCKVKYADLDGAPGNSYGGRNMIKSSSSGGDDHTFDLLLKEAQAKLRKRKV
ncbi:NK-tumor recognition protein-like isoform X2 [Leptopilina heterotoma]|uniref:NK-tumor recognition protein-like isoform X2 n=1 Tax=Leptopilina heterotoma TaxID=63436 RepID=UPI001CA9B520|nr:NK-tumor recognition protein-like isoform X2 [Leptopilina heterotoma]XP_043460966.1 NK-tumor recognition protein-like isoform X2 [Leptopilina heterotoma]